MIKKTSIRHLPVIAILTLGLTGCATTRNIPDDKVPTSQEIVYEVKPGDQLGSIAERLTGKFDNWSAIASYNGITNPRTLAAGQLLSIPPELLSSIIPTPSTPDADATVNKTTPLGNRSVSTISVTTGNSISVVRSQNSVAERVSDITVSPVRVNRTFDLEPIDEESFDINDTERLDQSVTPQVRVRGTYYPKGIYQEPANYARLIKRAAPGSVFPLESKVNAWYKIITDDGVGYIRQSDSVLVD